MCGLIGVAGKSSTAMDKMFRVLLILDTVRGEHSTGVLLVDSHGLTSVHKAVGAPHELFDSRSYNLNLGWANNVMLGHNRYATKGVINKRNAHPFEHEHIIGAHNGTLATQYLLDDYKDYAVDSDNLYHHMSINGVQDTVKKLGGAFALSWYDTEDGTLNFVRNNTRPLYICYSKDFRNVMWASEKWMLQVAADKAQVEIVGLRELPAYKHYSLLIPQLASSKYPILSEFSVEDVEAYVPAIKKQSKVAYLKKSTTFTSEKGGNTTLVTTTKNNLFTLLNNWVDFSVLGLSKSYKHMVEVKLIDHDNVRCRVLCKASSNIHKQLIKATSAQVFQGVVSRVNKSKGWTLNIKGSSVDEVHFDITTSELSADVKFPVGYPATYVSLSDWEKAVQVGCSWCSDVPQLASFDAFELAWFSKDEFVCESCSQDTEIKHHLHLD